MNKTNHLIHKEEHINLSGKNLMIGLSCIPSNLDEKFLSVIFNKVRELHSENLLVFYADTLQLYGYKVDRTNHSAKQITEQLGNKMKDLIHLIPWESHFKNIQIMDWNTMLSKTGHWLELFTFFYEEMESFKLIIDKMCLIAYNKRYPKKNNILEIKPQKLRYLRMYFLEELFTAIRTQLINSIPYDHIIYPINKNNIEINNHLELPNIFHYEVNQIIDEKIIPFILKNESIFGKKDENNFLYSFPEATARLSSSKPTNMIVMSNEGLLIRI